MPKKKTVIIEFVCTDFEPSHRKDCIVKGWDMTSGDNVVFKKNIEQKEEKSIFELIYEKCKDLPI